MIKKQCKVVIPNSSDGCSERDFSALLTPGLYVSVETGGREAQCGRRTKINWTKIAHRTSCLVLHLEPTISPVVKQIDILTEHRSDYKLHTRLCV